MADAVNMSLDEIIKKNKQQNRTSRSRGRGGGGETIRGRGGGRGGARGRGRGRGGRGRSQTRAATPGGARQARSRSRGPRGRSQSRGRPFSRARSRSRQNFRSQSQNRSFSRSRSRSRSRGRALTPKGRAGLEEMLEMPPLTRPNRFNRGRGGLRGLRRSNSIQNLSSIHTRLGVNTRRGTTNVRRPLVRRGVAKRGRGLVTGNIYSSVGLRSDQILQQQRQSLRLQNALLRSQDALVRSQTFTRSRNNSFSSPSQLTVKVANDFALKKRRNSFNNANYLNRQSLQQLNNHYGGGYNFSSGPGSVISLGSNKSNRSSRSNRSRGRGRGRGGRGLNRNFVAKQVLNPKLQKEIAAIQGKSADAAVPIESPLGVNFAPTPAATTLTLHQRFGSP